MGHRMSLAAALLLAFTYLPAQAQTAGAKAAAKAPYTDRNKLNGGWGEVRLPDGTIIKQ